MSTITIVLADDHQVVRQGLRVLLDAEPDFHVVGECGNGLETVGLVESLKPDVLVVDVLMPGLSGLEVTRRVVGGSSRTRVVVLSMHAGEAYVLEALRNGATGYVLKDSSAAELMQAIRKAAGGWRYLSPPLSERTIDAYLERAQTSAQYGILTSREREVLHLTVEGYSKAEIADRLSISPRTVDVHRANLMRKLGLRTRTELVRYALQNGILPMQSDKSENGGV